MATRDPSGAGPGPTQGTRGKDKGKGSASGDTIGAGTRTLTEGLRGDTTSTASKARDPSGAGPGPTQGSPGSDHYSTRTGNSAPGGGTTTQWGQTPGAVENRPWADALTVTEKIFGPLVPGVGGVLGAATVGKKLAGDDTTVLGGDPGPQRGWQPDRYRGAASLGGIGGSGGAVNSGDREIAGRPLRAESKAPTDEEDSEITTGGSALEAYSDVMMQDRRKPGLKQMLETML